jgi:hypothetical protein
MRAPPAIPPVNHTSVARTSEGGKNTVISHLRFGRGTP